MRTGRPKQPAGTTLPDVVATRMKPDEREAVELAASFAGRSVSDWARAVLAHEARNALAMGERTKPAQDTAEDQAKRKRAGELVLALDAAHLDGPPTDGPSSEDVRAGLVAATGAGGVSLRAIARAAGMSHTGLGRFMAEPLCEMAEQNRVRVAAAIIEAQRAAAEAPAR